jgi:hypothetical protein
MVQDAYQLNLGPIITALKSLICEDPPPQFKASEIDEALNLLRKLYETMLANPSCLFPIYQEVGANVLMFLSLRLSTQKIAARSIGKAGGP